ncbi:hypothetical protein L798_13498 [Zootermopsis nevadensis]|uniref:Uncharacterized protein n=1 Tax=Zootermopsis nevadensis TaxID=136037 RepID=A0A067QRP1_ZOONE|nr:hypothetical protein L798_13498 [Zootermopsis nevadensis]
MRRKCSFNIVHLYPARQVSALPEQTIYENLKHIFRIKTILSLDHRCETELMLADGITKWQHCVRPRMCKNSMREPLHGWTMEVTQSHRTHVGLHKRCTQLYYRGRVLNQVATSHFKSQ